MSRPLQSSSLPHRKRIWELDALRGFLILCVPFVHGLIMAPLFFEGFALPAFLEQLFGKAGILFVLLSGLCATLGSRSFQRGLLVFGCGLVLELGSLAVVRLFGMDSGWVIRFGILLLLGTCMLVYPALQSLPPSGLLLLGAGIVAVGVWMRHISVTVSWLYPIGLHTKTFSSGDYFPIFPNLGWFCIGAALGKIFYTGRETRLSHMDSKKQPWRFLCLCGRYSLWIFLFHLPVVLGILYLLSLIFK